MSSVVLVMWRCGSPCMGWGYGVVRGNTVVTAAYSGKALSKAIGFGLKGSAQFGCTALIWAVEQNNTDVAVLLLERGADSEVVDNVSQTA